MSEKLDEAIEYWKENLHAYCESGSPRDHLAINDIDLFLEEMFSLRSENERLREVLKAVDSWVGLDGDGISDPLRAQVKQALNYLKKSEK